MMLATAKPANAHRQVVEDAVCVIDLEGRLVAVDRQVADWIPSPIGAASLADIFEPAPVAAALEQLAGGDDQVTIDASLQAGPLNGRRMRVRMRRLLGGSGELALVTFQSEAGARRCDSLTGLADRRAVTEQIASWCASDAESALRFTVLFIDLDNFKRVNDCHGHAVGDQVLTTVAQRLADCVREGDLVARYGGDEFVILLKDVATAEVVEPVIERLTLCAQEPVIVGPLRLQVSATIGAAIAEEAEVSIEELIDTADRDMYARKRRTPK